MKTPDEIAAAIADQFTVAKTQAHAWADDFALAHAIAAAIRAEREARERAEANSAKWEQKARDFLSGMGDHALRAEKLERRVSDLILDGLTEVGKREAAEARAERAEADARTLQVKSKAMAVRAAAKAREDAAARIAVLEEALTNAAEDLGAAHDCIEAWSGYASDYFKDKHDLAGDLAETLAAQSRARAAREKKP